MIYYTGDIHGNPREIVQFCDRHKLTEQDTLVLLGDVGGQLFPERAGCRDEAAFDTGETHAPVHPRQS